tara:strand:- start:716 stop:1768 length:1053 start_codon:yes stop_codon:yes gene_type:complete
MRLFARAACDQILVELHTIRGALISLAERETGTVIPGYTHLQRAQPILLGHHLLAYEAMFNRDSERISQTRVRINVSPLGSGALAGVAYPIDREMTANELGFDSISTNSLDAVSDRDFVVDLHSAAALAMVHISRLSEEIILWVSDEFHLATLDDAFATGSSIMPQKKNADVAELARGKSARVIGNLMQSLALLKSQPLAYNKDNQEDKESLFDTVDTLVISLRVMSAMLPTLAFDAEAGAVAAVANFALATDYADYLSKHGVPFRDAHEAVGKLVLSCEQKGQRFDELSLEELQEAHQAFQADALEIDLSTSLNSRDIPGGTGPVAVATALKAARVRLDSDELKKDEAT